MALAWEKPSARVETRVNTRLGGMETAFDDASEKAGLEAFRAAPLVERSGRRRIDLLGPLDGVGIWSRMLAGKYCRDNFALHTGFGSVDALNFVYWVAAQGNVCRDRSLPERRAGIRKDCKSGLSRRL